MTIVSAYGIRLRQASARCEPQKRSLNEASVSLACNESTRIRMCGLAQKLSLKQNKKPKTISCHVLGAVSPLVAKEGEGIM